MNSQTRSFFLIDIISICILWKGKETMLNERRKGKHLSLDDRKEIQKGLRIGRSFAEIAQIIDCCPDTISKEIRKHRYHQTKQNTPYLSSKAKPNRCRFRYSCRKRNVCSRKKNRMCRIACRECLRCNQLCPDFIDDPCRIESKAPYVCNNCRYSRTCLFDKYLYNAEYAHKEYLQTLSLSRQGIDLTRDELAALDSLVSPLILKGQPIAHIYQAHKDEIPCTIRTLYISVESGYLSAKKMDLRRAVRYRKRKKNNGSRQPKTSSRKKAGHHYRDFQELLEKNPAQRVVEMDTVEGSKGGKILQTFLWRENNLMLAFLLDDKEMSSAAATIDFIEDIIGTEKFKELFPVILTDNGSEFMNPDLFEINRQGEIRTKLYYCDPGKPNQKGCLEKNHEYIRYVIPKGKPFDELSQEKILLMLNHINSTARPQFSGRSPIELAEETFGKNTLRKLGMHKIPSDQVHLKPELLK